MFSLQSLWDETITLIKREQALLVPLALATLGLGNMAIVLLQALQAEHPADATGMTAFAIMWLFMLLIMLGHLAIITLALRQRMSVGEALRHASTCIWRVLAVQLGFIMLIVVIAMPAIYKHAPDLATNNFARVHLSGAEALWLTIVLAAALWVSIRLIPIQALQVDSRIGIADAIKRAFAMTKGHAMALTGFMLLLGVVTGIAQLALHFVLGSLFTVIGKAIESPFTGKVLDALAQSALETAVGLVSAVFVAKVYQRLSGGSADVQSIFG
jgi:membrane-anchored glycerophosphoryl diester phosphodiesterase (GDPDase)